ncbi:MAG: DUF2628 domain-containing protein [Alphaproteobacteria bacterium]|nr:DUF2628 domain-containing protein [Alphaproteobacteria bacterium]
MRLYTVQYRPFAANCGNGGGEALDPDVVLIKEGFCWPALFAPLLWLLYRRQFWGLLAYLVLSAILSAVFYGVGLDYITVSLLILMLSLAVAAQANDWRRWRLGAGGYNLVSVVAAGSLREAETIFFHTRWQNLANQSPRATVQATAASFAPLPASGLTPFATPFDPV